MPGSTPNPKKRGYLLPAGCKDLIDVLQPRRRGHPQIAGNPPIRSSRSVKDHGGLSDIEKYVAMVFGSQASSFMLVIAPPGEQLTVDVSRTVYEGIPEDVYEPLSADVHIQMDTDKELAARAFFSRHYMPTPEPSERPAQFLPDLPVYIRFPILPLPPGARQLSSLLISLFREVCGLTDESNLSFYYHEITRVA